MGQEIILYDGLRQAGTIVVLRELRAAAVTLVFGYPAGLQRLALHEAVHVLPADGAPHHGREEEGLRLVRYDLGVADGLDFPVLLCSDVCRAVILDAIHLAGIGLTLQDAVHLVHGGADRGAGILGEYVLHCGFLGVGGEVLLEDVIDDMLRGGILDQLLVLVCNIAIGRLSVQVLLPAFLVLEDGADAVGGPVAFVLIDGEHDIDGEAPVGRGGVVLLEDGLPVAVVGLQDGLGVVVVLDVAEPSVKLGDQDQVYPIGLHVPQQAHQVLAVLHLLAGGQALVGIIVHYLIVMGKGVVREGLLLGIQGQAFLCLQLRADTVVDGASDS